MAGRAKLAQREEGKRTVELGLDHGWGEVATIDEDDHHDVIPQVSLALNLKL